MPRSRAEMHRAESASRRINSHLGSDEPREKWNTLADFLQFGQKRVSAFQIKIRAVRDGILRVCAQMARTT